MSPVLKARVGGAWVERPAETGYVRVGGAWVAYGGGGGDPYEVVTFPTPPGDTDNLDGDQGYNMGVAFEVTATQDCAGVEWRVPDSLAGGVPGAGYGFSLWDASDNSNLARGEWSPVAGATERGLFAAAVTLAPGEYIIAVYTRNYVFTSGGASGYSTPSGNVVTTGGKLALYNGGRDTAPVPVDNSSLIFHVSPLMVV